MASAANAPNRSVLFDIWLASSLFIDMAMADAFAGSAMPWMHGDAQDRTICRVSASMNMLLVEFSWMLILTKSIPVASISARRWLCMSNRLASSSALVWPGIHDAKSGTS